MKPFFIIVLLLGNCLVSFAQSDTTLVISESDKAISSTDTVKNSKVSKISKGFLNTSRKVVGIDSFTRFERPKVVFWRSMILPGSGQIMNKQYWKLPIVYGAAAFGVFMIKDNSNQYNKYIGIVTDMYNKGETARPLEPGGPAISIQTYSRAAASFKRYRDYSWIGFGLGWTLFAVEANISAHLKNFDISDNLSLKVNPTVVQPMSGYVAPGVKLTFNFK